MGAIAVTLPSDGTTADVADYNTPITTIVNEINGNLSDANISASAAISGSKLGNKTGHVVQSAGTMYPSVATGTTLVPLDDTIPQSTEGTQFMTQSITPTASGNTIEVDVTMVASYSVLATMTVALFKDSDTDAIAASPMVGDTSTGMYTIRLLHRMTAPSTTAIAFKVRAGAENAGTFTFNGTGGARRYGAITKSSIVVREIQA